MDRIYFLHAPAAQMIKIGVTGNLLKRLRDLQAASPLMLELLAHMPGTAALEREIHGRLVGLRSHGEWFKDGALVRQFVAAALLHDQRIPRAVCRTPKVMRAVHEVRRLTYLSEDDALQLVARNRKIALTIDRGRMRAAGALIAQAHAEFISGAAKASQ